MKKVLMLLVVACFVFAGTTEAKMAMSFVELDVNKDNKLSKEECRPAKILFKNFEQKDTNQDGFLSKKEKRISLSRKKK